MPLRRPWLPTPRRMPAVVTVLLALLVALVAPASAATSTSLGLGQSLTAVGSLSSPSGQYTVFLQSGNLVVMRAGFGVTWRSGRLPAQDVTLILTGDGDLQVRTPTNEVRWHSDTAGQGVVGAQLGNDGNFRLVDGSGAAVWQTDTAVAPDVATVAIPSNGRLSSASGQFVVWMQPGGTLVMFGLGAVFWTSPTATPGSRAVISGGNLQIIAPSGQLLWQTGTVGGNGQLWVQDDGNLVLYTDAGPVWATGTQLPDCGWVTSSQPIEATRLTSNGIRVHACLVDSIERLVRDARAQGLTMWGYGWRSTERQIELRIQNCGGNDYYTIWQKPSSECTPPTAIPGRSLHERGLAIDFNKGGRAITTTDPEFAWLVANAPRYGLKNFAPEPWHWSTTGG